MNKNKKLILDIASNKGGVRPADLISALGISAVAVHRYLKQLVAQGFLEKRGAAPKVIYLISSKKKSSTSPALEIT